MKLDTEEAFTIKQAAEYLGATKEGVRKAILAGRLEFFLSWSPYARRSLPVRHVLKSALDRLVAEGYFGGLPGRPKKGRPTRRQVHEARRNRARG